MAEEILARRTALSVTFDGTDITKDIAPYLLSLTYTDDTDDLADDLQMELQDRDGMWLEKWLEEAVEAAAGERLKISAVIAPENRDKKEKLNTGDFELDSVETSGPPAVVKISATSLAFSSDIRQTKKNKAWENYKLSGIAAEIAGNAGMGCMYESAADPSYERVEQVSQSDIDFLGKLCSDAGISIKATDGKVVLYDQATYEAKPPVLTIEKGAKGGYLRYTLSSGSAGTRYARCHVSYMNPATGTCIEGEAEDGDVSGDQCLEITAAVRSAGEAAALAGKLLRKHNRFSKTAAFAMPGNVGLVAGVTVQLDGWGGFSGKYIVTSATHTVGGGGYTTQIKIRKVLAY